MDDRTLTLDEFVQYAEIYPFTKDNYLMEKSLMELSLVRIHIESYDLYEVADLSLQQQDVLLVECGLADESEYVEQVFIEKADGILGKIKGMFSRIARSIASMFRRIGDVFTGSNAEIDRLNEINATKNSNLGNVIRSQIQSADQEMVNDATARISDLISSTDNSALDLTKNLNSLANSISSIIGGGGAHAIPISVPSNSSINMMITEISKEKGVQIDKQTMGIYNALLQPEYQVTAPTIIADLETIIEHASKLISFSSEDDDYENAYQSAKLIHRLGTKANTEINNLRKEIQSACSTTKVFTLNREMIDSKMKAAEKLAKAVDGMVDITNVGDVDRSSPIMNVLQRMGTSTEQQRRHAMDARNHAAQAVKKDQDMKFHPSISPYISKNRNAAVGAIKKAEFLNMYTLYMNQLNQVAVNLQTAMAMVIKIMTEHIDLRNKAIKTYGDATDVASSITNAAGVNKK